VEKIILLPEVIYKLNELINILYEKEYFGFIESSFKYVNDIYDFIHSLPTLHYKETANKKFGEYYCSYKANRNTIWYITFDKKGDRFIVQYITNNHTEEYPYFISKIQQ